MKVNFIFEDKDGSRSTENEKTVELDSSKLIALFNCDLVEYPVKMGNSNRLARAKIEEVVYDMFREEIELHVKLKEV